MILLLSIFTVLLINYLVFLYKIKRGIRKSRSFATSNNVEELVSIIIPFRNEANNILNSVKSLTNQNFDKAKFEIIYVDDNSDDNSLEILRDYLTNENIKIIKSNSTNENKAHKKLALKKAIDKAQGELIITTDADCTHGENWLATMVSSFEENTGFVSGPVEFNSDKKLFSELQKIEFSSLILVGAGLIGADSPIICNAANLGFRKSVFNLVDGYNDNLNLSSGDDEFLMQKIFYQTDYKVKFCFNKDAMSFTSPNETLSEFYQQRKRWASKSFFYIKKWTVLNLFLVFLFYLGIIFQILLGMFFNPLFLFSSLISIILKTIFEYMIVIKESKGLFYNISTKYFIFAEIFHIPYILIASISGLMGNYKWKGRKVKR